MTILNCRYVCFLFDLILFIFYCLKQNFQTNKNQLSILLLMLNLTKTPLIIDCNWNYNFVDEHGVEHVNFFPFVWIETEDNYADDDLDIERFNWPDSDGDDLDIERIDWPENDDDDLDIEMIYWADSDSGYDST